MVSVNDRVWFKYAQGIQIWAEMSNGGTRPDPNAIYFIPSTVVRGPAPSSFVPEECLNHRLFQICDALVTSGSPIYDPVTQESYFDKVFR